jgi:hypothetical protein
MTGAPLIEFGAGAFDPMKVMAVRHRLAEHPLLQLPKLVELAGRLAERGAVRYHAGHVQPGTDFIKAPELFPVNRPAGEIVANIEKAQAWMGLHNIQQDDEYRRLVDEVLDDVRPRVEAVDPGMHHRAGWIFVSSPGAITPFHLDHEHNFILQIRGKKLLHVWEPLDRLTVPERALELFHANSSRELVRYDEECERRAHVFRLEPGVGGYMPTNAPHWVKNDDNVSITVSFTYYTEATRRRALLYVGNNYLRKMGLAPSAVGQSLLRDETKFRVLRAARELRRMEKRLRGGQIPPARDRYAPAHGTMA